MTLRSIEAQYEFGDEVREMEELAEAIASLIDNKQLDNVMAVLCTLVVEVAMESHENIIDQAHMVNDYMLSAFAATREEQNIH